MSERRTKKVYEAALSLAARLLVTRDRERLEQTIELLRAGWDGQTSGHHDAEPYELLLADEMERVAREDAKHEAERRARLTREVIQTARTSDAGMGK